MKVTTPNFEGSISPKFDQSKKGLVLVGYDADYKASSAATSQQLSVKIKYVEVENLLLPEGITASVPLPVGEIQIPLKFANCRAKKR